MASVVARNVVKAFGSTEVLHGIDVEIPDKAFVVLVGPSGCGKSTLLRMIAGLEKVTAGEISIGGQVVNNVPPKQRNIAMVFQNYALYPHMKVFENMAFSLRLAKASDEIVQEKVHAAADALNLREYLDRYPRQLSGGQRQRVAIGRAMVRDPQVFLFDEPLSNLDAKLRVQMRTELKELHQRIGGTSIYVTHDQIEALTMGDRIVVMRDGYVEQVGSPLEVYDYPNNIFVASFIGSPAMNLFAGTVTAKDGLSIVLADDGTVLPLAQGHGVSDGRRVVYGIRPEYLALSKEGQGFETEVVVVEPTGADILVIGRTAGQELRASFHDRHDFRPGQRIWLNPRLDTVHLFDQETTRRLELDEADSDLPRFRAV